MALVAVGLLKEIKTLDRRDAATAHALFGLLRLQSGFDAADSEAKSRPSDSTPALRLAALSAIRRVTQVAFAPERIEGDKEIDERTSTMLREAEQSVQAISRLEDGWAQVAAALSEVPGLLEVLYGQDVEQMRDWCLRRGGSIIQLRCSSSSLVSFHQPALVSVLCGADRSRMKEVLSSASERERNPRVFGEIRGAMAIALLATDRSLALETLSDLGQEGKFELLRGAAVVAGSKGEPNWERALEVFENALSKLEDTEPHRALRACAENNIGYCHQELGRAEEAKRWFARSLATSKGRGLCAINVALQETDVDRRIELVKPVLREDSHGLRGSRAKVLQWVERWSREGSSAARTVLDDSAMVRPPSHCLLSAVQSRHVTFAWRPELWCDALDCFRVEVVVHLHLSPWLIPTP